MISRRYEFLALPAAECDDFGSSEPLGLLDFGSAEEEVDGAFPLPPPGSGIEL